MSLTSLMKQYNDAVKKEKYTPRSSESDNEKTVKNISSIILIMIVFGIVLWVYALVILIKYWDVLPTWAKVLGIVGVLPLIPFGPIITIIVVLVGKGKA
jgi:hypothetical protein